MADGNEHEVIYLQPRCCVDWSGEGRQWCQDDVWDGDDCEGHKPSIKYVRADTIEAQEAEITRAWEAYRIAFDQAMDNGERANEAIAELTRLREALEHIASDKCSCLYSDPRHSCGLVASAALEKPTGDGEG